MNERHFPYQKFWYNNIYSAVRSCKTGTIFFFYLFLVCAPEVTVLDLQHVVVLLDVPQADHLLVGAEVEQGRVILSSP